MSLMLRSQVNFEIEPRSANSECLGRAFPVGSTTPLEPKVLSYDSIDPIEG